MVTGPEQRKELRERNATHGESAAAPEECALDGDKQDLPVTSLKRHGVCAAMNAISLRLVRITTWAALKVYGSPAHTAAVRRESFPTASRVVALYLA
jgi:hypothetical protein